MVYFVLESYHAQGGFEPVKADLWVAYNSEFLQDSLAKIG